MLRRRDHPPARQQQEGMHTRKRARSRSPEPPPDLGPLGCAPHRINSCSSCCRDRLCAFYDRPRACRLASLWARVLVTSAAVLRIVLRAAAMALLYVANDESQREVSPAPDPATDADLRHMLPLLEANQEAYMQGLWRRDPWASVPYQQIDEFEVRTCEQGRASGGGGRWRCWVVQFLAVSKISRCTCWKTPHLTLVATSRLPLMVARRSTKMRSCRSCAPSW